MKRIAICAAVLALAAACSDGTTAGGSGRTQVLLTDAPFGFDSIARVDVYIKEIDASASTDTTGLTPQNWVTIAQPLKTYNLLDFQQGTTALAGEVDLPAGQYRAVRVVINTSQSHIINKSGGEVPVQWPVAGELTLYAYVENALDVPPGGAQIVIDFDVGRTFMDNGSGGFWFIPWIRAVNNAETGSLGGTVTTPDIEGNPVGMPNVPVTLLTSPGPGAMAAIRGHTSTDAQGHYLFSWLQAGMYGLAVIAPTSPTFNGSDMYGIPVVAGQKTTVDIAAGHQNGGGGGGDTTGTGGGGTGTGPVATVAIQPATQTVSVGDSVPVMVNLTNAQGQALTGRTVTWTISDSTKVSLFGSFANWAVLRAYASGSVTVTATSEGKSGTATVVVR